MMSQTRILIAGAMLLAPSLASTGSAQPSYPRTIGSGENVEIDYGPAGPGNIVGGGRVVVSGSGEDVTLRHLDPEFTQAPRQGFVPVVVGSGESSTTVWVPAGMGRTRVALIGADGSLPAEAGGNLELIARRAGD